MTTTSPTTDHEVTPANRWMLVALSPELGSLSIPVTTSMSIGRQADNDVVLAAQQISRRHAKFNQVGTQLYLQDLNSANGTFVNGEKIGNVAVAVTAEDEIGFADLLFVMAMVEDSLDTDMLAMLETADDLDNLTLNPAQPQVQPQAKPVNTETPVQVTTPTVAEIATETVTLPPQVVESVAKPILKADTATATMTTDPVAMANIAPQTISPVATTPASAQSVPKPTGANHTWLVAIAIILLIAVLVIAKMVL